MTFSLWLIITIHTTIGHQLQIDWHLKVSHCRNCKAITYSFIIIFEARGSNDVQVLFSFCHGCDGFEIVIGGWSNTYSVIREFKQENATKTQVWYTNTLHFIFLTLLDIKYPKHEWNKKILDWYQEGSKWCENRGRERSWGYRIYEKILWQHRK